MNHRRTVTCAKSPRATRPDEVSDLLLAVRNGEIVGSHFCAEISRLDMSERVRLIETLLREYKDLNNFTASTAK